MSVSPKKLSRPVDVECLVTAVGLKSIIQPFIEDFLPFVGGRLYCNHLTEQHPTSWMDIKES